MEMGFRLGTHKLFEYIHSYGFGEKSGIDLLGEAKGIVFKESRVGPVELATSSFGQGNSATPIQLTNAMSAAINRTNINVQNLTILAAHERRKELVYMAAYLDPHTSSELSMDDIKALCDDLFEAHKTWLPKYE